MFPDDTTCISDQTALLEKEPGIYEFLSCQGFDVKDAQFAR